MPLSDQDVEFVRRLVREQTAIALDSSKSYLVEARLSVLAREKGLAGASAVVDEARRGPGGPVAKLLVEAMTTNETSFFRDGHPFEALRLQLIPELRKLRANTRRLSILCAACSSGQEPYSIAILLKEHFPELHGWSVRIMACDYSSAMLTRAATGRFSQLEVNRGLPATYLVKYFTRRGLEWELREDVRKMVEFSPLNLNDPFPPLPALDLVFLRNVLIYFEGSTKGAILRRVRDKMQPDGYLLLGSSELMQPEHGGQFEHLLVGRTVVYRPAVAAGTRPGAAGRAFGSSLP